MTTRRMGPAAGAMTAVLMAAPATADAATLTLSRACYVERTGRIAFTGDGFRPGARYTVRLGRRTVARGTVGPGGRLRGRGLPAPTAGGRERAHRLSASDATATASAVFRTTVVSAGLRAAGSSSSLLVRFSLRGFIAADPAAPGPAYLHYLSPRRHPGTTVVLGTPRGACGVLTTPPRRLFAFRAAPGTWRLQFDLHPRYARRARPPVASIDVPVIRAR